MKNTIIAHKSVYFDLKRRMLGGVGCARRWAGSKSKDELLFHSMKTYVSSLDLDSPPILPKRKKKKKKEARLIYLTITW